MEEKTFDVLVLVKRFTVQLASASPRFMTAVNAPFFVSEKEALIVLTPGPPPPPLSGVGVGVAELVGVGVGVGLLDSILRQLAPESTLLM